jgi:phage terminase Nu1 subunit (DNA packaging protein)
MDLSKPLTQESFGGLVGISQQAVAQMVSADILKRGATGYEWMLAYCERLREQAAGRASEESLELMRANTALSISRRRSQDMKNAVLEKQYAPVALLTEVLASAASIVATSLDSLIPTMMREGLVLTDAQRTHIATVVARARNEWVDNATDSALLELLDDTDAAESTSSTDDSDEESKPT